MSSVLSPSVTRVTARMWTVLSWLLVTALVAAQLPGQRASALATIQSANLPELAALDPHLLSLAANVGVALALVLSSGFYLVYQGIGASLESRLVARGEPTGSGPGPFWWTSLVCVAGTHLTCIAAGLTSVRGAWAWYAVVALVGPLVGIAHLLRRGRSLTARASLVLVGSLLGYSLLSVLF